MTFKVPEKYRVKGGQYGSNSSYGKQGAFKITSNSKFSKKLLLVVASEGEGWEHVSVSLPGAKQCPKWTEMCYIREMFWDKDDLVIQYHPVESEYVNCHPFTLHLWRKCGTNDFCETPPMELVGPK